MYAICAAHVLGGAALPWLLQTAPGQAYLAGLAQAFGIELSAAPRSASLLSWLLALLGAMIAGWGVLMAGLVRLAHRDRRRAPLDLLAVALLTWAALDMGWSASRGVWLHLWLDSAALLAILLPVWLLRRSLSRIGSS